MLTLTFFVLMYQDKAVGIRGGKGRLEYVKMMLEGGVREEKGSDEEGVTKDNDYISDK